MSTHLRNEWTNSLSPPSMQRRSCTLTVLAQSLISLLKSRNVLPPPVVHCCPHLLLLQLPPISEDALQIFSQSLKGKSGSGPGASPSSTDPLNRSALSRHYWVPMFFRFPSRNSPLPLNKIEFPVPRPVEQFHHPLIVPIHPPWVQAAHGSFVVMTRPRR